MTFRIFAIFLAALILFLPGAARAEAIGTVVEIEGTATLSRAGGTPFALKLNDQLQTGDMVATGAKSRLFILLADNTEWTLAENTRFRVDEYLFDSEDSSQNRARYSATGGFRYVSGLLAKKANPDVSINSSAGTIGIRGTDISIAPDTDGSYDVYVDDGAIDVASGGSFTRLQRGQGTTVARRGAAPIAPKDWKQGRLERLRAQLKLARGGELRNRIQQLQPRQLELREKLRARIQQKKGLKKEGLNREQKQELRREKAEQRKAATQKRRAEAESRREAWQEKNDSAGSEEPAEQRQRRLKALQQRIQR